MAGLPIHGGGGKLSLKRRRREERGAVLGNFSTDASWFESQELSDAEATWITLLRAVDPHLNQSNLEKFVSFPEFHPKSSQIENPQPRLETFNCGTKIFEWVPFPVYHRDWEASGSGRHQNCTPGEKKSISPGEHVQDETYQTYQGQNDQDETYTAKKYMVENPKGGIRRSVALEDEAFEIP